MFVKDSDTEFSFLSNLQNFCDVFSRRFKILDLISSFSWSFSVFSKNSQFSSSDSLFFSSSKPKKFSLQEF